MSEPVSGQDRTSPTETKAKGLIAVKKAALKLRKDDFNASPPEAAWVQVAAERPYLGGRVWDCASKRALGRSITAATGR